ncbi:MAG: ABC transporter ATP-binding protein [Legionellales bacterium]|nr:ABC transporter ATP-binding protein [Legionellales bacterium]
MNTFSGIRTQALSFSYLKDRLILNQIHSEFKSGKITALLGDNGSGKTTLLRIIAGIIKPSAGSFFFNDLEINSKNIGLYKQQIGYMPETLQLYPDMRPFEALSFFNKLRHGPAERVDEILERVDLIQHKDKKISELSKGMKQRLNLAQAIVSNPKVLILDEPSNGFDTASVNTFYDIIRSLAKQNTMVILSNHQFAELGDHADDILVLAKGKVQIQGSMAEFISGSQHNKKRVWLYFDTNIVEEKKNDFLKRYPESQWISEKCLMAHLENAAISPFISNTGQYGLHPCNIRVESRELQALLEAVK